MQALTHSFFASAILFALQAHATEITLNTSTSANPAFSYAVNTQEGNSATAQGGANVTASSDVSITHADNTETTSPDATSSPIETDVLIAASNQAGQNLAMVVNSTAEVALSLPEQVSVMAQQTVNTALTTAASNAVQQQLTSTVSDTVNNSVKAEVAQALQQNIRLSLPGAGN